MDFVVEFIQVGTEKSLATTLCLTLDCGTKTVPLRT
jgi:hypothetical protein